MKSTRICSRIRGFTLVELLVVIAIIAVLIGLLLPAVQKIRDMADRSSCQNNFRQVGLALHRYHDDNQVFPPGQLSGDFAYCSWMTVLLPYVEQPDLWNAANQYAQENGPQAPGSMSIALNNPAASAALTIWSCPADPRPFIATPVSGGLTGHATRLSSDGLPVAFTWMLGNVGTASGSNDGILYPGSKVNINQITDGASTTIMVGERPPATGNIFGWWFWGAGYDGTGLGDYTMGTNAVGYAAYLTCSTSNGFGLMPGGGMVTDACFQVGYWSMHSVGYRTGGANFLFADGSVKFLQPGVNNLPATGGSGNLFQALGTIAGGETFAETFD